MLLKMHLHTLLFVNKKKNWKKKQEKAIKNDSNRIFSEKILSEILKKKRRWFDMQC